MHCMSVCFVLTSLCSTIVTLPHDEHVKKLLQSKNYTVTWGSAPTFEPIAELEIGDGVGHGGTLEWFRFLPGTNGIDVLWRDKPVEDMDIGKTRHKVLDLIKDEK